MKKKLEIQAKKGQYYAGYDDICRFISYFYQIDLARSVGKKKILEVGVGNRTVSNYLKHHGFKVTTCDYDKDLEPDYVADIRNLPFEDSSFEVVLACEILEHLPWEEAQKALAELHRVSSSHVIVSIPYPHVYFELVAKFPLVNKLLKRPFIDIFLGVPLFPVEHKFTVDHYWEMGKKGYPIGRIRKSFEEKGFRIMREQRPVLDVYHYFFVLEKR